MAASRPQNSLSLDLAQIKAQIDLREVVASFWGRGIRSGKAVSYRSHWRSDDRNPSFAVYRDGYKDFGTGESGDVFTFLQREREMTFLEAVAWARGYTGNQTFVAQMRQLPRTTPTSEPPSAAWQQAALQELELAERQLWANEPVLSYLRQERGLSDETIRQFRLGYNPAWKQSRVRDENGEYAWLSPGIIIPVFNQDALWAIHIRSRIGDLADWLHIHQDTFLKGGVLPKYLSLAGSKFTGSLFNGDALQPNKPVLFVEGEFDCLLAQQILGNRVTVVTLGSASNRLSGRWLRQLQHTGPIYLALDNDAAGNQATQSLIEMLGKRLKRLAIPQGKDVTNFVVQHGGNLIDWFETQTTPDAPSSQPQTKTRFVEIHARYLTEGIGDWITKPGGYLIASELGTGKTEAVARAIAYWKAQGYSCLCITPRRFLTRELGRRLGCACQLDLSPDEQRLAKWLATTLPSLIHQIDPLTGQVRPVDVVVIDEIEQVIAALYAPIIDSVLRVNIFQILQTLIQQAKIVVCLDADAGEVSRKLLESSRPDIICITNTYRDTHRPLSVYWQREALLKKLDTMVGEGSGPIAVACSSAKEARILQRRYADFVGKDNVLLVCRDTANEPAVQAFIHNPDAHIGKYKVVIYTSAMMSGVDISKTEVAAVFGFLSVNRSPLTKLTR
jgi:hypothetical protein